MNKIYSTLLCLSILVFGSLAHANAAPMSGTFTIGATGANYTSISSAVSDLKYNTINGPVILLLQANYTSTREAQPLQLTAVPGAGEMNTITIRPAVSGLSVSGNGFNAAVYFNGCSYFIIDGRVNGTGEKDLKITQGEDAFGGTSVVQFENGANHNVLKYVRMKMLKKSSGGVVNFMPGVSSGSNYNTVTYCDLDGGAGSAPTPNTGVQYGVISGAVGQDMNLYNHSNTISYCNIYDYFTPAASSQWAGVYMQSANTNWTIEGNHFYQTVPRIVSGSSNRALGISIATSLGSGFNISNNYFGGSAPYAAGAMQDNSGSDIRFVGIYIQSDAAHANNIQGNTINNIKITSSNNSTSFPYTPFTGICLASGNFKVGDVKGNVIGSKIGRDSIYINSTATSGSTTIYGIASGYKSYNGRANILDIRNNLIGGITMASGHTGVSLIFEGILVQNGSTVRIINNTVGNDTVTNSIRNITGSTNTGTIPYIYGIVNTIPSNQTVDILIDRNVVANLSNHYQPASTGLNCITGIISASSSNVITNNKVHHLSTTANASGLALNAPVVGIRATNANPGSRNSVNRISGNVIHDLSQIHPTTQARVNGIITAFISSGKPVEISGNLIYNLYASTNNNAGLLNGILVNPNIINTVTNSPTNISNNVIRLGFYDSSGFAGSIKTAYSINGISRSNGTNLNLYHNTIYIGGEGVDAGTGSTAAFIKTVAAEDSTVNNIFVNVRSVSSGAKNRVFSSTVPGAGMKNYSERNLYYVSVGNTIGIHGGEMPDIHSLRDTMGTDFSSAFANPGFVNPKALIPDLRLTGTTAAERAALPLSSILFDIDSNSFPSGQRADLGAYQANNTPSDIFTPLIRFSALKNADLSITQTLTAYIEDESGVAQGANKPRLYFKQTHTPNAFVANDASGAGWKYVTSTDTASPYRFTVYYDLLNNYNSQNAVQYFVVAQDSVGNVGSVSGGVTGTSVSAITGKRINSKQHFYRLGNTIPAVVTVGSGGTYTSFTNNGGLFDAINKGLLKSNVVVSILSNLSEPGSHALNEINEYPAGSNYTITIRPSAAVMRRIASSTIVQANMPVFSFNGARGVIIDGRFEGEGSYITLVSSKSTVTEVGPILALNKGADVTIRNTQLQSNSNTSLNEVIHIFSSGNKLTLLANEFSQTKIGVLGPYARLMTIVDPDNTIVLDSNKIYGFVNSPIRINTSQKCTITNNHFYSSALNASGVPINLLTLNSYGGEHLIKGNYFGGQEEFASGAAMSINNTGSQHSAITVNSWSADSILVSDNVIRNINHTGNMNFSLINASGNIYIKNNLLGDTVNTTITAPAITGINIESLYPVEITNNILSGITSNGFFTGIKLTAAPAIINNNKLLNIQASGSIITAFLGIWAQDFNKDFKIKNNVISNFITPSTTGGRMMSGMYLQSSAKAEVSGNIISKLYNNSTNFSSFIRGIYAEGGSYDVFNNMISIDNGSQASELGVYGIYDNNTAADSVHLYNNSIYIGGTSTGTGVSYAYLRGQSAFPVLRNNLFVNKRTGGQKQVAVQTSSAGWNSGTSDYNVFYSANPATTFSRNGTDQTFAVFSNVTGSDVNSNYKNIKFKNAAQGNLHIANPFHDSVYMKGVSFRSLMVDIDGKVRPAQPMRGAAEADLNPTAINDTVIILEDEQSIGDLSLNDTGNGLYNIISGTKNGSTNLQVSGEYVYTPALNFFGRDTLVYRVCGTTCDTASLFIEITSVNDAPIAIGELVSVEKNVPVVGDVSLNDSDVENDDLTYTSITSALHGVFVFNNDGTFSYDPHLDYTGFDSVKYEVCDNGIPSKCDTATLRFVIAEKPLPISLLSFDAKMINENIAGLYWKTASELNMEGFNVERLTADKKWEVIGFVRSQGDGSSVKYYEFEDSHLPSSEAIYYRLSMLDRKSPETHSAVRYVKREFKESRLSVYPNPSNGLLYIHTGSVEKRMLTVKDATGREILSKLFENQTEIDLSSFPQGVYLLLITGGRETQTEKIIIR